jgi:hypothetical protein
MSIAVKVCNIKIMDYIFLQSFNFLLLMTCTAYGYMTRNVRRWVASSTTRSSLKLQNLRNNSKQYLPSEIKFLRRK